MHREPRIVTRICEAISAQERLANIHDAPGILRRCAADREIIELYRDTAFDRRIPSMAWTIMGLVIEQIAKGYGVPHNTAPRSETLPRRQPRATTAPPCVASHRGHGPAVARWDAKNGSVTYLCHPCLDHWLDNADDDDDLEPVAWSWIGERMAA